MNLLCHQREGGRERGGGGEGGGGWGGREGRGWREGRDDCYTYYNGSTISRHVLRNNVSRRSIVPCHLHAEQWYVIIPSDVTWTHILTNKLPELESNLVVHSSDIVLCGSKEVYVKKSTGTMARKQIRISRQNTRFGVSLFNGTIETKSLQRY